MLVLRTRLSPFAMLFVVALPSIFCAGKEGTLSIPWCAYKNQQGLFYAFCGLCAGKDKSLLKSKVRLSLTFDFNKQVALQKKR